MCVCVWGAHFPVRLAPSAAVLDRRMAALPTAGDSTLWWGAIHQAVIGRPHTRQATAAADGVHALGRFRHFLGHTAHAGACNGASTIHCCCGVMCVRGHTTRQLVLFELTHGIHSSGVQWSDGVLRLLQHHCTRHTGPGSITCMRVSCT
jgi:hypothetical protein